MAERGLTGNQLKLIAIATMTLDHLASVIWPNYATHWWLLCIHALGRISAPVFWFLVAEGYRYTRSRRRYAARLLLFAAAGHFAYNFAFGIPFVPFRTSVFNQTSVLWALFWGVIALMINDSPRLAQWQKTLLIIGTTLAAFCADWSSIAVLAILQIHQVYGLLQLFVALAIPLLARYNGQRGSWRGMKWFFYLYYPLHLLLCGLVRLGLHGDIGVMIGG